MTKLILDIPDQKDLDILLPLLSRLKIHFTSLQSPSIDDKEVNNAISIILQGCEMSDFGDAISYQTEVREDRVLPFSYN